MQYILSRLPVVREALYDSDALIADLESGNHRMRHYTTVYWMLRRIISRNIYSLNK